MWFWIHSYLVIIPTHNFLTHYLCNAAKDTENSWFRNWEISQKVGWWVTSTINILLFRQHNTAEVGRVWVICLFKWTVLYNKRKEEYVWLYTIHICISGALILSSCPPKILMGFNITKWIDAALFLFACCWRCSLISKFSFLWCFSLDASLFSNLPQFAVLIRFVPAVTD